MILTVTLNVAIDKAYRVDALRPGEVMRVRECSYTAGGKGLNVSKVAKIAGADVVATGFVGGHAGAFVEEQLDEKGIRSDFVHVRGETRSCINVMEEETGRQSEFLEPGFAVCEQDVERLLSRYDTLLEGAQVVTISGSIPRCCDETIYARLILRAAAKGKRVILDTSGRPLEHGIKANPTLIKPNRDEIGALTGRDLLSREEVIASAVGLHKSGVAFVVISLGRDGALMVCGEGVFHGETPDIPVVNTVGCGDSMVAAFAVGLERGYEAQELLRFALAVSTANAMTMETGFYRTEDLPALYDRCSVTRISGL
ncbi:MAG: 1-phosphofructokinase [Clostridia bacterium]|nr:1-phosphofructokinase [Clostridia bacterium]